LLEEAQRYLVGGVNSPVRAFRHTGAPALCLVRGEGAYVLDERGQRFIDLIMGWGALLLGHAHPSVTRAVRRQVAKGWHLGLTNPAEVELAKTITEALPGIEQVRFTASGTEACMTAIRLARAATGRSKVLSFEGCYHGHSDGLLANSAGVPKAIAQETIVVPYNDLEALEDAIGTFGDQMACAILEPVAANMGVVVPEGAFLRRLRDLTRQRGILLIFDEVVTGFRVAYGGAQTIVGVTPDLTVLGKVIGGGFPIGAVAGPQRLMQQLAPEGCVYHAGTFAGHPVAMVAGLATLNALKRRMPYERLESLGTQLTTGLLNGASRAGVPMQINRVGSMFTVFFSDCPVKQFADVQQADAKRFARFANALRHKGVLLPPSPFEAAFLSVAHTQDMVEHVVQAAADAWGQRG